MLRLSRASFKASEGIYGAPRVFLDLREAGETRSKYRVARLMRENGLRALHGYRTRRWDVGKPAVLTPNLLKRHFSPAKANAALATDITYVRTWQGWLYLAVVIDLFARKVVGWAAGPTIHRELVLHALASAVTKRRPRATIIHSDQGVPFGSDAWRRFCRANHREPSMRRKGHCWDNAVVESFFSSLKKERIEKGIYPSRDVALADIADYIDTIYNRTRRHSHLGGVSPEEFEVAHKRGRRRASAYVSHPTLHESLVTARPCFVPASDAPAAAAPSPPPCRGRRVASSPVTKAGRRWRPRQWRLREFACSSLRELGCSSIGTGPPASASFSTAMI